MSAVSCVSSTFPVLGKVRKRKPSFRTFRLKQNSSITQRYRYSAFGFPKTLDASGVPVSSEPVLYYLYTGRKKR